MPSLNTDYIAVDVAKKSLRVALENTDFDITNDLGGFRSLQQKIAALPHPLVVVEATGGYERALMNFLFEQGVAVVRVNPARVRAFANSEGIKAKTDPIDARMLLCFARQKKLQPMPAPSASQQHLTELMDRRSQLSEDLAREKNRLEKDPVHTRRSIEKMIRRLEKELECIDAQIEKLIEANTHMKEQFDCMEQVKGVGKVTAWTILAYLGEITLLNRNQLTALAGIAPFNRDSGERSGRRTICAGRAKVRKCLYMAATSAAFHNPVIQPYVAKLRARGKPFKCAIVAAMRKLLLHIQSLLKKQQFSLA